MKLDNETRRKLKVFRAAKRAERKLRTANDPKQRMHLKRVFARGLKTFQTPAELKMGEILKPLGFEAQVMLCGFIVDFAHFGRRLIVEVDGPGHQMQAEYDHHRTLVLNGSGWHVMRFKNADVQGNFDEVKATFAKEFR